MRTADLLAKLKRHGAYPLPEEGVESSPLVEVVSTALGPVAVLTRKGRRWMGAHTPPLSQERMEALALKAFLEEGLREKGVETAARWGPGSVVLSSLRSGRKFALRLKRKEGRLWAKWGRGGRLALEPGSYHHLLEVAYAHLAP